ncbi:MAG: transporter substrate-binding domain-containing protein [Oscillospiraceae bacterium]|nr:transporter substrate-binding domain-containing protein [Oscillospiraceae bacterium]
MKKALSFALSALMTLTMVGCGAGSSKKSDSDFQYITDKGKMIVGITDYAPMDYKDDDGNWTGFDAEFAQAVGKKMGVDVEFMEINWDNKFLELNAKSIDCVWNGMTITEEVTKNTSCSKAYVKNEQVVVMKSDKISSFKDAESMKTLKFCAESGSAGESAAKDAGFDVTAVSAQSDALMEVASGSVDACVIDGTMAAAMTGEGTSYTDLASSIVLTTEEYGVGFRKDSDMTEKFNTYMDELKADGTLTDLAEKYELSLAD